MYTIPKDTYLIQEFFYSNNKTDLHYRCLYKSSILIPGKEFFKTTSDLKLILVPDTKESVCSPDILFKELVFDDEDCPRDTIIKTLDKEHSRDGIVPHGYIDSNNSIIIFKSSHLTKIKNTTH